MKKDNYHMKRLSWQDTYKTVEELRPLCLGGCGKMQGQLRDTQQVRLIIGFISLTRYYIRLSFLFSSAAVVSHWTPDKHKLKQSA